MRGTIRYGQTRRASRPYGRGEAEAVGGTAGARRLAGLRRRELLAGATAALAVPSRVMPQPAPARLGLEFPGSAKVRRTMRFRFLNPLPIYPATYIWRALPRRQAGYYTAFFWGNDDDRGTLDTFLWKPGRDADSYYGAHPYPVPPPRGTDHRWEISVNREDVLGGPVDYGRWHTQALRVWGDSRGKHHDFYWDLPRTDPWRRLQYLLCPDWGEARPPRPALTWGDAPWAPGKEVWCGVLRGLQIYSARLSQTEILREVDQPGSTRSGAVHLWYLNLDPTPDDIGDRSGRGNQPEWVGDERPALWRG